MLINIVVGGLFLFGSIHLYKKHKEAKAEYLVTKDTGYRTLSRVNFVGCVAFTLVFVNNVVLLIKSLLE